MAILVSFGIAFPRASLQQQEPKLLVCTGQVSEVKLGSSPAGRTCISSCPDQRWTSLRSWPTELVAFSVWMVVRYRASLDCPEVKMKAKAKSRPNLGRTSVTPNGAACRGMLGMMIVTCMCAAMVQTDPAFSYCERHPERRVYRGGPHKRPFWKHIGAVMDP